MKVQQLYTGCLAEAAYYIESNGEAVIIDPLRETKPYLNKLAKDNAKLKYIFETHFHADFVSGHLDLAKATGATIVYGPTAAPSFDFYSAKDEEELKVGKITFKILHTPGHTPESTTFLLFDEDGKEYAIFTGDTLFIGDVGRPDLAQKVASMTQEELAGCLFDSLRKKIMPLPNEVIVYPGHGAGSACGKNMSEETWDSLGHQKNTNYALRENMTRDEFIKEVTHGLAPPPVYFGENVRLNKTGYGSIDDVLKKGVHPLDPEEFEKAAYAAEALIIDTRSKEAFAEDHIPGSIFIGIDGSFAPWVGSLVPDINQAILVITPEGREEEVIIRLARVGYDNTLGYLEGGVVAWKEAGKESESIISIPAGKFEENFKTDMNVLDLRKESEFISEHVEDSLSFPLNYINNNMDKLNRKEEYYLYCKSGYRSLIAASILKSRGFNKLIDITGGLQAIEATSIPRTDYVCPSMLSNN